MTEATRSHRSGDERPIAAIALWPPVTTELLTDEHYAMLERSCSLPRRQPIEDFGADTVTDLLAQVEVLVTGWGCPRIGSAALARMPRLRLVAHAAGTVRDLVSDSFWSSDVRLSSAADANAVPVAEFTLGAILLAGKRAFTLQRRYREVKEWRIWSAEMPPMGNHRKTVGIVGYSRIGRRVVDLLRPFDLDVVVFDPYADRATIEAAGARLVDDLDELLAASDVVSLHAPLLDSTRGMIDRRRLALLRDGAVFVNTARGGLVDLPALTDELVSGRFDAVLDVTEPEVLPPESPIWDLPNVFLTPHIAGAQGTEIQRLADLAMEEIGRFLDGEPLRHEVRREDLDRIA